MRRAAVSVFLLIGLTSVLAACGDHEPEPALPTYDFTPVATIAVDDGGIDCTVDTGSTGCELASGSVVTVVNEDDVDHHLIGTSTDGANIFDTGVMQPDDEMTLVLDPVGTVTVTDELWRDGDSPTLDITVVDAPPEP